MPRILHTRWLRVCSPICCAIVLELDIGDLKNLLNRHILVLEGIIMLAVLVVIVVNESALIEPPLKYVLTFRQHFAKHIRGDVLLEQERPSCGVAASSFPWQMGCPRMAALLVEVQS